MNYLVLRRKNGSIRLLLPTENGRVMRSALQMYYPSRLLGHIYKFFNYIFLPLLSKFNYIEKIDCINRLCPHLNEVLKSLELSNIKVVGVLVSDVGPRSKSTLKIMNLEGDELSYARIALLPAARKVVEHEVEVLKVLMSQNVAGDFPQILSSGTFENPKMSYSIQSVGSNKSSGELLSLAHLHYLDSLVKNEVTSFWDTIESLMLNLKLVVSDQRLMKVIDRVYQSLGSIENFPIMQAIEHGDFAPWNIRKKQGGELFVFDWEHADLSGLVWMDVLHFVYQVESLVNRKTHLDIYMSLIRQFDMEYQVKNLNKFSESQKKIMIVIYLLKSIFICHKEGSVDFDDYHTKITVINIAISDENFALI
ncbi:MAG: hypothetical protein L3J00_02420 [Thiomicrorhabdus sp.]|nr:hypothetical protein [Thiomicrorhabdus sp.]